MFDDESSMFGAEDALFEGEASLFDDATSAFDGPDRFEDDAGSRTEGTPPAGRNGDRGPGGRWRPATGGR